MMYSAQNVHYLPCMDSGLYAAYTGLLARTQALDTASNNLANASTTGFRAQRDYFRGVLSSGLDLSDQGSQVGNSVNSYGVLGGSLVDLGQGPLTPTANPLDFALSGTGLFAIRTKAGIRYTRDGSFSRSATGQLQTAAGEPVLDDKGRPITLPTGPVEVSEDGTIAVAGAAVAKIGVYTFPKSVRLTTEGTNRLAAGPGDVPVAGTALVRQGVVEGANQDSAGGSMSLVLLQRQAEMMQKALTIFDGSFDKTAEELARV